MDRPVSLSRLLLPDCVIIGLKAKSYKDAVRQLLDRLDASGQIVDRHSFDPLVDAEIAAGDLPTLGTRALLAHYRGDAESNLAVAIGTASKPFVFAPDKAPAAQFLVLIVAPRSAARYYLKTLAALATLLADPEVANAMAAARSAEDLLAVIAERDVVIRPELAVSDLMSRDFQTVSPETLLSETLHLMARYRRRGVPVVSDNGEVLGIVTEVELLEHYLPQILGPVAEGRPQPPIQDIEVRDAMQRSVMCLSEDQLITDVLTTMLTERGAQFPVVREGKLVGFLSRTDIIKKLLEPSV
jgi:CBS domain-containing protein